VSDHPTDLTRSAEPAEDLPPPPQYRPPVAMPAPADAPIVPSPRRGSSRRPPSPFRNTLEWVAIVVVALGAAFLIKTFLIQAFYIPSPSMVPTLQVKDRVLVNKLSYDLHAVHRGDIVVFTRPPNEGPSDPAIKDLIKRVIGLPGDTIEARDGRVIINDHPLREPYLPAGVVTLNLPRMTVPAGQYFVMGDNRLDSKDSRIFGPISRHLLVGRAFVKVWPLSSIEFL
jgi:signal peptidase I